MTGEQIFLDTWFIVALLNVRDEHHEVALSLYPRVRAASRVVMTEAVVVETCNGLAKSNRAAALRFIKTCYADPRFDVLPVTRPILEVAFDKYQTADDKEWGLTDCISFVVMREHNLQLVATGDHHFRQAGFVPLVDLSQAHE